MDGLQLQGRNLLFNSSFQVWQRGTSISITSNVGTYTADRWEVKSGGVSENLTIAQITGATSGSYACRVQRNSGQTGVSSIYLCQSLTRDMCLGTQGNILTLSFSALCGANYSSGNSYFLIALYSGTGTSDISGITGAFTGVTLPINISTQVITTTLTTYTFVSTTIPTNSTQLAVQFAYVPVGTASVNDWFQVSNVSLTIGPYNANNNQLSYAEEVNRCQYFYQPISNFSGYGSGTTAVQCSIPLLRSMRTIPTVSQTGNICVTDGVSNYTASGSTYTVYSAVAWSAVSISGFTGLTSNRPVIMNYSGSAFYITLDSELY